MGITTTPDMGLPLPNPAGSASPEPGPQYAADNNQAFTIIDRHNHSPGSGVQITPAGLDINTNLSFQSNNATNVHGILFSAPAASALTTFLYTNSQSGGGITDLFYNDGAGNVIALTKAGAVNATIASIPGESYAGGTFTWKQGAGSTTPANFDIGSITIRPTVAATTNGVVLGPPSGISSQYNVQLPLVPASVTGILQINTSGDMISSLVADNSTLIISSQVLQINPAYTAAQQALTSPSGAIVMYGGTAAPSGWLLCDGTSYLRATYSALFAAIGTAYGTADGTHFNVPDMRGYFPRGTSNGSGNDPDASSRTALNTGGNTGDNVGSYQADQNLSHTHSVTAPTVVNNLTGTNVGPTSNPKLTATNSLATEFHSTGAVLVGGVTSATSGGNQSNPRNVYVNFIIKT